MQISKITNFYYFLGNIKYSSRELQISRDTQQCKSPKFPNPCNSIQNVVKTDQLLLFFGQYIHQESFKSQETHNNAIQKLHINQSLTFALLFNETALSIDSQCTETVINIVADNKLFTGHCNTIHTIFFLM